MIDWHLAFTIAIGLLLARVIEAVFDFFAAAMHRKDPKP